MNKVKIVITGGPSGGKTTLIEAIGKDLDGKVAVVPEAASILYRGGFPRKSSSLGRVHAQRAICFIQRELEDLITLENNVQAIVCDRGSLDSIAYWPGDEESFFKSLSTSREKELARYQWVIHLDTASSDHFDLTNPIRTETHKEAVELNALVKEAWRGHPQRLIIQNSTEFLEKITKAKRAIKMILASSPLEEVRAHLNE